MTVLPVIVRELRAESRRGFTYWLRVLGGGALIGAAAVYAFGTGLSPNQGDELFLLLQTTLITAIWILVPLATADCISRERREGTLGLLFLTPLTGRDIVIAKGLVHGLRALTLCLAALPVLTIPFLMGGVDWKDAVLSGVVSFSSLCWALAAGLLASSICKHRVPAQVLAAGLGFLFFLVVQGLSWPAAYQLPLSLASVLGLLLVIFLASRNIRRRRQEEPPSAWQLWLERTFCTPVVLLGLFRRWMRWKLERNPIGWLERRRWSARLLSWSWMAVLISVLSVALGSDRMLLRGELQSLEHLLAWLFLGSLALSAAGSFRRERETGVLELLLVAPLQVGQIIGGRLRALWGQFLPAMLLLAVTWLYTAIAFAGYEGTVWLFFYAASFLSLPVIGLYFSLRQNNLISAFLSTLAAGILAPWVLTTGLLWIWVLHLGFSPVGPPVPGDYYKAAWLLGLLGGQGVIALILAWRLHRNLARRTFALERTK